MKFPVSFLALLAVAQSAVAFPFGAADEAKAKAPAPVTELVCNGDSYMCTAYLDYYGDGKWVAQWNAAVFHLGLFGTPDHKTTMAEMSNVPVPVESLECDGNTYKCTARLRYGDGKWVAQWSVNVFEQSLVSGNVHALAHAPVRQLTCDGNTYKCTADLEFGNDFKWVAQWGTSVFHTSAIRGGFLSQD